MRSPGSAWPPRTASIVAALLALAGAPAGAASCTLDTAGTAPAGEGGGGPGGAGGGAGAGSAENCLDGADGDGDGMIDCADPDCAPGYACVDAPADGWPGVLRIQRVNPPTGEAAPACPGGATAASYWAGPAGPPDCVPCTCTWADARCTSPEVSCYDNTTDCTGVPFAVERTENDACVGVVTSDGYCRITAPSVLADPGTCGVAGGGLTNPAPWQEQIHGCATEQLGAGCDAGQVCAPKPPETFDAAVCVRKAGSDPCPAGWTSQEIQAYEGGDDTRACSACACDATTTPCSGGAASAKQTTIICGGSTVSLDTCGNIGPLCDNFSFGLAMQVGSPGEGTCSQGQPSGALDPVGDTKICCKPAP